MPYIFGLEGFHFEKIVRWSDSNSNELELQNVAFDLNLAGDAAEQAQTFK